MTDTIGDAPLAAFDLETTGPNPLVDRIVTAHLSLIKPGEPIDSRNWLLDPEIDIPEGASNVHGITTEHAREHGSRYDEGVEEIVTAIWDAWGKGYAVVAFNATFDLTMLHHESERLGIGGIDHLAELVIDPFVLDKALDQFRKGKRNLGVTCEHYGVTLGNAHEAEADALAAARLAWIMIRRFNLATMTVAQAMETQARWYAEQQSNFAKYLRGQARKATDPTEAAELKARADAMHGEWPIAGLAARENDHAA